MSSNLNILKNDLCLGCGLCASLNKDCRMQINSRGFYVPSSINSISKSTLTRLCPGINVQSDGKNNTSVWGNVESVYDAWSSDSEIRHSSASGGVTTSLAIFLLESGKVDGVLHVGHDDDDYLHNRLFLSKNREEVKQHTSSRYAPADVFSSLFDILDENPNEKYVFIGKPCDIACVKNIQREYKKYRNRIPYTLAIFCAGMPNYNGTLKAIDTFKIDSTPVSIRYRGDGWPGYFTVRYQNGTTKRMTYTESWRDILSHELGFRCKICPDGIGLLADIASGDSWKTKDGYPDFTDSEGKNFCFIRTKEGERIFQEACDNGYIIKERINTEAIKTQQRYQFFRRHLVGWRIAIVQILTFGMLRFKGLGIYRMAARTRSYKEAIIDAFGTATRLIKTKKRWSRDIKNS